MTFSYSWPLQAASGEDKVFMDLVGELGARKDVALNKSHNGGNAEHWPSPQGEAETNSGVVKR